MRLVDRLRAALRGLFEGLTSTGFYWIVMIAGELEELANIFTEYGHGIFLVSLSGGTLMILLGALLYHVPWPSYRTKNWAGGLLIAGVGIKQRNNSRIRDQEAWRANPDNMSS